MLHGLGQKAPSSEPLHAGACGSEAVHRSISICHLLLRCPIVCLYLFYAAQFVLVFVGCVCFCGEKGGFCCSGNAVIGRDFSSGDPPA